MKPLTHLRPIAFIITLLLCGLNGFSQVPTYAEYSWGQGITGGDSTAAYYKAMDVDTVNDRIVVTGTFTDTVYTGGSFMANGGMYLASYDTSGALLWLKKEGFAYMPSMYGLFCPTPMDLKIDNQGYVWVAGTLCGDSLNSISGTSVTKNGYFIAKYLASGTLVWLNTYDVTPNTTWFRTIILETGYAEGFAAFTYGDSIVLDNTTLRGNSHQSNVAVMRLDAAGNENWTQNFAGDFITPKDLKYEAGTLYLAGDYDSLYTSIGNLPDYNNAFIAKINGSGGNLLSLQPIADWLPNYFDCQISAIDIIYSTGSTRLIANGRFQGDIRIGNDTLSSIPGQSTEIWYGSFDLNLSNQWVKDIVVAGQDYSDDILAMNDYFVISGRLGMGGVPVGGNLIKGNGFLAAISPTGKALWTLQQPDSGSVRMTDIEGLKGTDDIYIGGGLLYRGIFNRDTVFNRALFNNTVSEVSYVAKASQRTGCNLTVNINNGADTLISCQAAQLLTAAVSNSSGGTLQYFWRPSSYFNNASLAGPTVVEHIDRQQITMQVEDSITGCVARDTIVVGVYLAHFDTIALCPGDSVVLDLGPGATMYDWNGFPNPAPLSQTVVADTAGMYWGVATYNTAPVLCGSLTSFFVITDSCTVVQQPDSVWPGDANSDGLADLYDVLNIGIGYNVSGPVRTNASTVWTGQAAQDWNLAFLNGLNLKHADCDGNGLIDSFDVSVVSQNYGLTHAKDEGSVRRPGSPQLLVSFSVDTTQAPGLVTADISLGDVTTQVVNGYGIAFSLLFDPTLVDSASVQASYANSWLGAGGSPRSLTKNLYSNGKLDLAHTRTDHTNVSGYGHLATVSFYIQDNIIGKDFANYNFGLEVSGSRLISANESEILLDEVGDEVLVLDEFTGIGNVSAPEVNIYPNPGNGIYTLSVLSAGAEATVTITNLLGQQVLQTVVSSQPKAAVLPVDLSAEASGIYLVKIQSNNTTVVKRLVKQ